jgi:CrcB protein
VNVVGSFALSLVAAIGAEGSLSPTARLVLSVGVLGGFTTYSSFNHQTLAYLDSGDFATAAFNVALTLTACLAASVAGLWLGRFLSGG